MGKVYKSDIYDGKYSITSDGKVFNNKTKRELKQFIGNKGYWRICLYVNKKVIKLYIHRLIAKAFMPNPECKPCINHKNSIRTDNRLENLEWVTQSENIKHAFKNGKAKITKNHPSQKEGFDNYQSKQCVCVLTGKLYKSAKTAAIEFNMAPNTLRSMLRGDTKNTTTLKYKTLGEL